MAVMGAVDIEVLMNINKEIKKLQTKYSFKVDHGSFETAIEFITKKAYHPPKAKNWDSNPNIKCPDLLDFSNRLIIEFEEEGQKKRPGASLASKGHGQAGDISNKRDTNRDSLYRIAGFRVLKIWESQYKNGTYIEKLKEFLTS